MFKSVLYNIPQTDDVEIIKCKICKRRWPIDTFNDTMTRCLLCQALYEIRGFDIITPEKPANVEIRNIRSHRISINGGTHSDAEWSALLEKYNYTCLACGRNDLPMTKDHIIPVVRGGKNSIDNLQPLCMPCNSKKHTRIIDYRPKE